MQVRHCVPGVWCEATARREARPSHYRAEASTVFKRLTNAHFEQILPHIDTAVDLALERRREVAVGAVVGTLLFLLLFRWFTGASGATIAMGFVLGILESALGGGLVWLYRRYGDEEAREQRRYVAYVLSAFVDNEDFFSDWDNFLANPMENPELEAIRQRCKRLPEEFPPSAPGVYCGPAGLEVLRDYAKPLQGGIFSQFIEDLRNPRPKPAAKAGSSASAAGAPRAESKLKRFLSTIRRFLKWAAKKRAQRKQAKQEKTAARQAARQASQQAAAVRAAKRATAVKGPRAKMHAPAMMRPGAAAAKRSPARSAKAVKRKAKGNLTEAGAIQLLMQHALTAAQFDQKQQQMLRQRGQLPTPAEVVRALLHQPKMSKAAARKKQRSIAKQARRQKRRHRSPLAVPALLLLVLLPCMPLAAWRIPDGDPVRIEGEVRHELLHPAADPLDLLRTPFELLWGNKPVDLANGTRLYLTKQDYERCRPQSANAYRLHLTAEARPLLFGGYEVVTLKKTEKTDQPLIITN